MTVKVGLGSIAHRAAHRCRHPRAFQTYKSSNDRHRYCYRNLQNTDRFTISILSLVLAPTTAIRSARDAVFYDGAAKPTTGNRRFPALLTRKQPLAGLCKALQDSPRADPGRRIRLIFPAPCGSSGLWAPAQGKFSCKRKTSWSAFLSGVVLRLAARALRQPLGLAAPIGLLHHALVSTGSARPWTAEAARRV